MPKRSATQRSSYLPSNDDPLDAREMGRKKISTIWNAHENRRHRWHQQKQQKWNRLRLLVFVLYLYIYIIQHFGKPFLPAAQGMLTRFVYVRAYVIVDFCVYAVCTYYVVLSSQYSCGGLPLPWKKHGIFLYYVQSRRYTLFSRHSFACPTHLFFFIFFCWFSFLKEFYYWNSPWLSYTHSNDEQQHQQWRRIKMKILLNIFGSLFVVRLPSRVF